MLQRAHHSLRDASFLDAGAALAAVFFVLPLVGILGRVPWLSVGDEVREPRFLAALALSVLVSLGAVALSVVVGVPLAIVLARASTRWRSLWRAVVAMPLMLPPVVVGVGLLLALGRRGFLGGVLERCGIVLPFSTAGAVLAGALVAAPFFVLSLEAGLASLDPTLLEAARSLGASQGTVLRTVVIPLLWPSLRTGLGLSFARALGEFGATITFAGNLSGRTQTLPLLVYEVMNESPERAALLSLALLVVATGALTALRAWPQR